MTCSPQLLEILRGVAAIHEEFPRARSRGFAARVRAVAESLALHVHASTLILAEAMVVVCAECGIRVADVVADVALREDVIDAAMGLYADLWHAEQCEEATE
jgi:hypothetical protein